MKKATKTAFESSYGFVSPGFTVDQEGNLNAQGLTLANEENFVIPGLTVTTDGLIINNDNRIILKIGDFEIVEVTEQGLSSEFFESNIDESTINNSEINNSEINNSEMNNTVIGNITPAAASFTSVNFNTGTITATPQNNNDITKKSYVDLTSIAFSVALGS